MCLRGLLTSCEGANEVSLDGDRSFNPVDIVGAHQAGHVGEVLEGMKCG